MDDDLSGAAPWFSSWRLELGRLEGDLVERLNRGAIGGRTRRNENKEVASTAGFYVTHNPPVGLTRHPARPVHALDPQSNVGYPPGEVVVDVSLNRPPSKGILRFLELETKRVLPARSEERRVGKE